MLTFLRPYTDFILATLTSFSPGCKARKGQWWLNSLFTASAGASWSLWGLFESCHRKGTFWCLKSSGFKLDKTVFCTSVPVLISCVALIVPTCANTPGTHTVGCFINHSDPYFDNAPSAMLFKAVSQRRDFRIWNFPLIHIVQKNQYSANVQMPWQAIDRLCQLDNYNFFSRYAMHIRRYIMHKSILETERLYLVHQSPKPQGSNLETQIQVVKM